ncbi:MAG: PAS domain-containing protein [Planctomycetota bacterium]
MAVTRPTQTRDVEREFLVEELFFSTTNEKGIIVGCNEVFARLSGYDEADLIGSAHSVVRHPDMPAAVFRLFWERLEDGQPIAAYVKNQSADGSYYWVMAMASPINGGYLSVRLKPTSELFNQVKDLYGEVLQIEEQCASRGMSKSAAMDNSSMVLLQGLETLGFPDYEAFMRKALIEETHARHQQVRTDGSEAINWTQGSPTALAADDQATSGDPLAKLLREMSENNEQCDRSLDSILSAMAGVTAFQATFDETNAGLFEEADTIGVLAINAVLSADSAGQEVISQILSQTKHETQTALTELKSLIAGLAEQLSVFAFDVAIASLQNEITSAFIREIAESLEETHGDATDRRAEKIGLVCLMMRECEERLQKVSHQIDQSEQLFWKPSAETNRLWRGARTLDYIRLAGKKEACLLSSDHSFRTLFQTLQPRIEAILKGCQAIHQQVAGSVQSLSQMRETKVLLDANRSQRESIRSRLEQSSASSRDDLLSLSN